LAKYITDKIINNNTPAAAPIITFVDDSADGSGANGLEMALQVGLGSDQFPKMVQVAYVAPDKTYPTSHENITKPELKKRCLLFHSVE